MSRKMDYELARTARKMIEKMFKIKKGETVVLTCDSGSDMDIVESFAKAAYAAGGKPMVIRIPCPRGEGEAAMPDLPAAPMRAALLETDIWLDFNSRFLLYSEIWETAMRENKKLRYLCVCDATAEQLGACIMKIDAETMKPFLLAIREKLLKAKKIKVTSKRGTDFTFETNQDFLIDYDDGNYDVPIFGTLPGFVNVVPKFDTMNGRIVFDSIKELGVVRANHVEFSMKDGKIDEFIGDEKVQQIKKYLENFDCANMFKISHMMISLNPGIKDLTGNIVMDERIYGGITLGFGHTSPYDAPPLGQPAKSHMDGIVEGVSIWIDDEQITSFGTVIHSELKALAEAVLEYAEQN